MKLTEAALPARTSYQILDPDDVKGMVLKMLQNDYEGHAESSHEAAEAVDAMYEEVSETCRKVMQAAKDNPKRYGLVKLGRGLPHGRDPKGRVPLGRSYDDLLVRLSNMIERHLVSEDADEYVVDADEAAAEILRIFATE